jgi:rSAM-associated Gly-rich repeat protein
LVDNEVSSMSRRQKYLKILSGLLPVSAAGVSLLLGSSAPAEAAQHPVQPRAADQGRIADRLAAIRDAVSDVAGPGASTGGKELAWWAWRNGGGGAWRNGGWRNGGWRNAGWRNGGWGNGWPNFWRNW